VRRSPTTYVKTMLFLGLVFLLTGLVATGLLGYFNFITIALCVIGIVLGTVVFLPRLTRNRWLYLNMGLYSLFFCAALVVVYLILQRHPYTYDATSSKVFSVSPVSRNFLGRLSTPIRATAFLANKGDINEAGLLFGQYSRFSPQFKYEILNPFVEAEQARRFGMNVLPGDIYLERLTTDTQKTVMAPVKLSRLTEEEITNGIVQLLRGKDLTLYFLQGHGELPLEENRTAVAMGARSTQGAELEWLREQLDRHRMKVVPLVLSQRGRVPADASVVVIAAPKVDLAPVEREALQTYLDAGGRAMFLLNPDQATVGEQVRTTLTNFGELLEQYGIEIPPQMIVMPLQPDKTGGTPYTVPAVPKEHRITSQLDENQPIIFDQARPVNAVRMVPEFVFNETFLVSGAEAHLLAIEDFSRAMLTRQKVSIKTQVSDLRAENLGIAAVRQRPGQTDEQASRIVVFGNGNFVSSRFVDQNAWFMFQSAINWLTDAGDLIAIPNSEIVNTPVILTAGEQRFLFILLVIAVPAIIGFAGLGYSITRRGHLNP